MTATPTPIFGNIIRLISQSRWFVLIFTVLFTAAIVGANVLMNDFEYRAEAQLLVVQYASDSTVDGEKMLRSTENISRNLTKVVGTTSFINTAQQSGKLPAGMFTGGSELTRKESWSKSVEAISVPNSSIIQIKTYDKNPQQAVILAQVVAETLIKQAPEYTGAAKFAVEVKQIDTVLVSPKPVRPNIELSLIGGLFGGFVMAVLYLLSVKEWKLFSTFLHYWRRTPARPLALGQTMVAPVQNIPQAPVIEVQPEVQSPVIHEIAEVEPAEYRVIDHMNYRQELIGKHMQFPSAQGSVVTGTPSAA